MDDPPLPMLGGALAAGHTTAVSMRDRLPHHCHVVNHQRRFLSDETSPSTRRWHPPNQL